MDRAILLLGLFGAVWVVMLMGLLSEGPERDYGLCFTRWCSRIFLYNEGEAPLNVKVGAVTINLEAGTSEEFSYEWNAWRTIELRSAEPLKYRIDCREK